MTYDLEMGKTEEQILTQAYRNNLPVPDKIKNAPELLPGLDFYYMSFVELSTCRDVGMDAGPIPWYSIREMGRKEYNLDDEDFDKFVSVIRGLDLTYLDHQESKRKNNGEITGKSTPQVQSKTKTKSAK